MFKLQENTEERIIPGTEKTELGEIPYQVFLDICGHIGFLGKVVCGSCGGTLVSERHIVTAAHCFRLEALLDWDFWEDKKSGPETSRRTMLASVERSSMESSKRLFGLTYPKKYSDTIIIYAGVTSKKSKHAIKRLAFKSSVTFHPKYGNAVTEVIEEIKGTKPAKEKMSTPMSLGEQHGNFLRKIEFNFVYEYKHIRYCKICFISPMLN